VSESILSPPPLPSPKLDPYLTRTPYKFLNERHQLFFLLQEHGDRDCLKLQLPKPSSWTSLQSNYPCVCEEKPSISLMLVLYSEVDE